VAPTACASADDAAGLLLYADWMIRTVALISICACGAPSLAQVSEPLPRFEALEKQQQMNEQRQLDNLEANRQQDLTRTALPNSGVSTAERALLDLEYNRERERLVREAEDQRQRLQRERDLAEAALPNMRVPRHSSLVVNDPERYILPPAPTGKYYARIEGRFVLVDAMSELVTSVVPVQPTDPTADVPAQPAPSPLPGLPLRRISPTSASVLRNFAVLALPPPPTGHYYARIDGQILLVDGRTELAIERIRPG
jgi:Ni/Co efflux regulator RcnB